MKYEIVESWSKSYILNNNTIKTLKALIV
jgi:hypothetical protein